MVHLPIAPEPLAPASGSGAPPSVRRGDVPDARWLDWRWQQRDCTVACDAVYFAGVPDDDDREGSAEAG